MSLDTILRPVPKPKPRKKVRRGAPTGRPRTRLKNRTRLKQVNRKRGGHAFPHNVDELYREWIRGRQCLIAGRAPLWVSLHNRCEGRVQVAHVKSRGAGGADHQNVLPLCALHHHEQHAIGKLSFEARYGLTLRDEAELLWKRYEAEVWPCP